MAIGRSVPVSGSAKNLWTEDGDDIYRESGRVAIGTDTLTTDAAFEISSTASAFLPSRMTTTQRDALTASAGMLIYNTTTSAVNIYTSSWLAVTTGAGGGITSVAGTTNEVEAATVGAAVTVGLPNDVTITGTATAGHYETNGIVKQYAYGLTDADEKGRNFKWTKTARFTTAASGWQDIVTFRPYMEGTTNDPSASTFWGAVAYKLMMVGHVNGAGNGSRFVVGNVQYDGSSASSSAELQNLTNGSVVSFRVYRVGWETKLQWERNGISQLAFHGLIDLEILFPKGAGASGASIVWSVS